MADDDEGSVREEASQVAHDTSDMGLITPVSEDKPLDPPKYEVRPRLGDKFQAQAVKDIILASMQEQLLGRMYRADQAPRWAKTIANGIRLRVLDLGMKRYKILVQATLIEMKGAGLKYGQRCFWDPETDAYVDDIYRSETLLCHTVVYGIYMY